MLQLTTLLFHPGRRFTFNSFFRVTKRLLVANGGLLVSAWLCSKRIALLHFHNIGVGQTHALFSALIWFWSCYKLATVANNELNMLSFWDVLLGVLNTSFENVQKRGRLFPSLSQVFAASYRWQYTIKKDNSLKWLVKSIFMWFCSKEATFRYISGWLGVSWRCMLSERCIT